MIPECVKGQLWLSARSWILLDTKTDNHQVIEKQQTNQSALPLNQDTWGKKMMFFFQYWK